MNTNETEYDIEKSIEFCPPIPNLFGRIHTNRIVVPIDNVRTTDTDGNTYQPRLNINLLETESNLERSLESRGWVYKERPIVVASIPGNSTHYKGYGGFNRIGAMKKLKWTHVLVDVYDRDPTDKEYISTEQQFGIRLNNDNLTNQPNSEKDFVNNVVTAISENKITPLDKSVVLDENYNYTDDDIAAYIVELVSTMDGTQLIPTSKIIKYNKNRELVSGCLLYKVRQIKGSNKHLIQLSAAQAKRLLQTLGRMDVSRKSEQNIYVFSKENPGVLSNLITKGVLSYRDNQKPVEVYCYIQSPNLDTLEADRQICKGFFDRMIIDVEEIFQTLAGGNAVMEGCVARDIFILKGALPQDHTTSNGYIKEQGIIEIK